MWKIVAVLVLTVLAMLFGRLAQDASLAGFELRSAAAIEAGATAPITPPLMYAGIRG
jgi:hypothetical protein